MGLEGCFQQPSHRFAHRTLSPLGSHAKPLVLCPGKTSRGWGCHLFSFLLLRSVLEVLMKRGSRGYGSLHYLAASSTLEALKERLWM